jgi:hypothetical protein
MLTINIENIEEVIFYDPKIHLLFPEFKNIFNQWKLGKRNSLRTLVQNSIFELLNSINDEHIEKLEKHLNKKLVLNKIDHHLVKSVRIPIPEENEVFEIQGYRNFATYRDGEHLYISFWR